MDKTLAKFIVGEYERLKQENDDLREIVECFQEKSQHGGFTDLNRKTKARRFSVASKYAMFGSFSAWKDYDVETLEALLRLDVSDLYEEATCRLNEYSDCAINERERTFPFTLAFKTYKDDVMFGYNPDEDYSELYPVSKHPALDEWVTEGASYGAKAMAVETVRDMIRERIEELKSDGE